MILKKLSQNRSIYQVNSLNQLLSPYIVWGMVPLHNLTTTIDDSTQKIIEYLKINEDDCLKFDVDKNDYRYIVHIYTDMLGEFKSHFKRKENKLNSLLNLHDFPSIRKFQRDDEFQRDSDPNCDYKLLLTFMTGVDDSSGILVYSHENKNIQELDRDYESKESWIGSFILPNLKNTLIFYDDSGILSRLSLTPFSGGFENTKEEKKLIDENSGDYFNHDFIIWNIAGWMKIKQIGRFNYHISGTRTYYSGSKSRYEHFESINLECDFKQKKTFCYGHFYEKDHIS